MTPLLIEGTAFDDFLMYTTEPELEIVGGTGEDIFYPATHSQDTSDTTTILKGEAGNDLLIGRDGRDTLRGGTGDDKLFAGGGNDFVDGGKGSDYLSGEAGDDTLYGASDRDILNGDTGDDKLFGGSGDDYLNGGDGNDYLRGGWGSDTLIGENGTDLLAVTDDDLLNIQDGDSATDTVLFRTNGINPQSLDATVEGFSAEDVVRIEAIDTGSIVSHFTTNNGVGDTLLYISHDEGYLSVIKFNGVEENFVYDRIKAFY